MSKNAKTIREMAQLIRGGDDPETAARILEAVAEQVARLESDYAALVVQATRVRDLLTVEAAAIVARLNKALPSRPQGKV